MHYAICLCTSNTDGPQSILPLINSAYKFWFYKLTIFMFCTDLMVMHTTFKQKITKCHWTQLGAVGKVRSKWTLRDTERNDTLDSSRSICIPRAFVNVVMNLRVAYKAEDFLTTRTIINPYRSAVELNSTAHSAVPGQMSSWNRLVILRCFMLVSP